jgi:hypothetical protein
MFLLQLLSPGPISVTSILKIFSIMSVFQDWSKFHMYFLFPAICPILNILTNLISYRLRSFSLCNFLPFADNTCFLGSNNSPYSVFKYLNLMFYRRWRKHLTYLHFLHHRQGSYKASYTIRFSPYIFKISDITICNFWCTTTQHFAYAPYLCALSDCHNKQQLFP